MTIKADAQVLGYLGRGLSLELSAVQLYTTQARLLTAWGLAEPAARLQEEAREEMGHVERIIGRMLALGAAPAASTLRPVGLGTDLYELLKYDQAFENELVALYRDAAGYCASRGYQDDRLFFQEIMAEEEQHARELESWLEQIRPQGGTSATGGARF